ncbi:hypothetical protein KM043_012562 [Ampulex compressa]|nr:hypothetical protein KM043_012562 [Ampulex compressa]
MYALYLCIGDITKQKRVYYALTVVGIDDERTLTDLKTDPLDTIKERSKEISSIPLARQWIAEVDALGSARSSSSTSVRFLTYKETTELARSTDDRARKRSSGPAGSRSSRRTSQSLPRAFRPRENNRIRWSLSFLFAHRETSNELPFATISARSPSSADPPEPRNFSKNRTRS